MRDSTVLGNDTASLTTRASSVITVDDVGESVGELIGAACVSLDEVGVRGMIRP